MPELHIHIWLCGPTTVTTESVVEILGFHHLRPRAHQLCESDGNGSSSNRSIDDDHLYHIIVVLISVTIAITRGLCLPLLLHSMKKGHLWRTLFQFLTSGFPDSDLKLRGESQGHTGENTDLHVRRR